MSRRRRPVRGGLDTDVRRTARRIGWQTGALLITCLLVVGAVAYLSVVRSQDQQMTQILTQAAQTAGRGDTDHDHDLTQPRGGVQTAVLDGHGRPKPSHMPAGLPDMAVMRQVAATKMSDRRTVHLPTGSYEVLTIERSGVVVQAVASRFEQHQERERLLGALVAAGVAGLVLSTLAAAVLARRAVRPMAQALDLQRRFVADAGHELRTPLTLLSTRAQLLARRVRGRPSLPSGQEDLIARDADGIVVDTAALTAILEELLVAADVRTPVRQEVVDLKTLVRGVVASAQAAADQSGISLVLDEFVGDATIAAGAPTALSRSVTALVDNALGHARNEVRVSVRRESGSVVVDVADDGPGISDEALPRIFTRFASDRSELPRSTGHRHFGLGLALVSEIATRHGGTVTASNLRPPATGAVLRLSIPG